MRILVTGASGFVGSALVSELIAAGHRVVGLARSDVAAAVVEHLGAAVFRGSLEQPESICEAAAACDAVAHLGFSHDFSRHAEAVEMDRRVIEALLETCAGAHKPLVITSGTALAAVPGRVALEADLPPERAPPRAATEALIRTAATHGLRGSIVRLAPTVHGAGDHGFVPMLIALARKSGVSAYVGEGDNRWPAVHRLDAARLFRLALEQAPAGACLHGVAETGVPMREIAQCIAEGLGVGLRSLDAGAAAEHFGWLARFVGVDNPTSSAATQQRYGWQPTGPGLIEDLRSAGYFG
jgi:nucleoside-diphosphate-sugar epimerase